MSRAVPLSDVRSALVVASLELRRDITRVIRRVRPDRVLTWAPEINSAHVDTS